MPKWVQDLKQFDRYMKDDGASLVRRRITESATIVFGVVSGVGIKLGGEKVRRRAQGFMRPGEQTSATPHKKTSVATKLAISGMFGSAILTTVPAVIEGSAEWALRKATKGIKSIGKGKSRSAEREEGLLDEHQSAEQSAYVVRPASTSSDSIPLVSRESSPRQSAESYRGPLPALPARSSLNQGRQW